MLVPPPTCQPKLAVMSETVIILWSTKAADLPDSP